MYLIADDKRFIQFHNHLPSITHMNRVYYSIFKCISIMWSFSSQLFALLTETHKHTHIQIQCSQQIIQAIISYTKQMSACFCTRLATDVSGVFDRFLLKNFIIISEPGSFRGNKWQCIIESCTFSLSQIARNAYQLHHHHHHFFFVLFWSKTLSFIPPSGKWVWTNIK